MPTHTQTRRAASPHISPQEMERSRTARFKKLKPSPVAYVDSLVRGHAREVYDVIGRGVTENKALAPAIPFVEDFNVTYVRCKPGNGAALHAHETVEVFFVMEGQFTVFWGGSSEHESVLKKWDLISIPPGVYRGFRNSGRARATLMAIFGGTDAGHVAWPKSVLKQARATGMKLDRKGNIISIPAAVRGSRRKA